MNELNPFAAPGADRPTERPVPRLDPPQTIKYQLLESDLLAATLFASQHSPSIKAFHRRYRLRTAVVGGAMIGFASLLHLLSPGAPMFGKTLLVVGGGLLLTLSVFYQNRVRANVRRRVAAYLRSGILRLPEGDSIVTIDHDGIQSHDHHVSQLVRWSGIGFVRHTPEYLFLFIQPTMPFIVPARAFLSEESYYGFCQLAERLWDEHRQLAPGDSPGAI